MRIMKTLFILIVLSISLYGQNKLDFNTLESRQALAKILPEDGHGCCARCNLSWGYIEPHTTEYLQPKYGVSIEDTIPFNNVVGEGCFVLCEYCWRSLTPAERLPYYRKLWIQNIKDTDYPEEAKRLLELWPLVEDAVWKGL